MIDRLLDFVGKKLGFDSHYFLKNISYLSLVNLISLITGFLSSVFFSQFLSKEEYGQYQYILTFFVGFSIFSLLGMRTSIVQAVARGYEKTYIEGLKISALYSVLGVLGLIGFCVYYYFINYNIELFLCFLISSIFFIPYTLANFYNSYLEGKKEFKFEAKYNSIVIFVANIILLLTIYFYQNLVVIILGAIIPVMILHGRMTIITIKRVAKESEIDVDNIKFGKKLSIILGVVNLATYFDKILLGTLIGFKELAEYSFAMMMPEQIKGLMQNFQILARPKLALIETKALKVDFLKKMGQILFFTVIVVFVYIIFSGFLFRTFFPKYIDSVIYSQVLSLSLIPAIGVAFFTAVFESKKKTNFLAVLHYSYSAMQIILMSILTIFYGIWGIIIARVLVRLLNFFVGLYLFYRL